MIRIVDIMGEELKWSNAEKKKQIEDAMVFLKTQMGKDANREAKDSIPITLTKAEVSDCVKRFNVLDSDKKGYVSLTDIRRAMRVSFHLHVFTKKNLLKLFEFDTLRR